MPKTFVYVNETYYVTDEFLEFTDALLDEVIRPERKKKLFGNFFETYAEETESAPDVAGENIPFDQMPFKHLKKSRLKFVISQFEELLSDTGCTPDAILRAVYNAIFPPPYAGIVAKTNQYICPYTLSSLAATLPTGGINFYPISIPYPVWIREMGIYITLAAHGEEARIGIYPIERGLIGEKIADNCIGLDTINWRGVDFNVHLPPSTYMFAIQASNSGCLVRRGIVGDKLILGFDKEQSVNPSNYILVRTYDGTLPDTIDNDELFVEYSSTVPNILARVEV